MLRRALLPMLFAQLRGARMPATLRPPPLRFAYAMIAAFRCRHAIDAADATPLFIDFAYGCQMLPFSLPAAAATAAMPLFAAIVCRQRCRMPMPLSIRRHIFFDATRHLRTVAACLLSMRAIDAAPYAMPPR